MDKIKIRKASRRDVPYISKIWVIDYSKKPYYEEWTKIAALKRIREYFKKNTIYVAEFNKQIIGFIISEIISYYDGKRGLIHELCILDKFQGKGVGKKLMKKVEEESRKKGAKRISLSANKKSGALKFYKKLRYKKTNFIRLQKRLK